MTAPGPSSLGRGVVVGRDDAVPEPWAAAPEVIVRDAASPDTVDALHTAWLERTPVVIRLHVDPGVFRDPPSSDEEPWSVGPEFLFPEDRLHFLVWANAYDAREGREPTWWWARKAARLGATETPDGPADVRLPDGTDAWIDGGPRQPLPVPTVHRESVDVGRLALAPPPVVPTPAIVLAADQMAAVGHERGAARIVAPAGSGKTRVLAERLRHVLGDRRVEADLVLTVAYNKKAQEELVARCAAFRPRVQTLNALGWELLGRPSIIEEREVRRIVEGLVPRPQRRANVDPYGPYLEALTATRLGFVDPAEVEDDRDDVPGFAEAYPRYREELRRRGVVDFDEQIYGAVERLLRDGPFRRAAQQRHRHLLVDEFQDLTPCHLLLLRLLASPELDVFGVGDDDQVIYGHVGATPAYLIEFEHLFPGAASHPLEVNYRCPVAVVDAARSLLSYNSKRVAKAIRSSPNAAIGAHTFSVHLHRPNAGAAAVVDLVQGWLADGATPADIAVLTRVGSLLLAPHVALTSAGLGLSSALESHVLSRTGVRAALAYLRIATSPDGFAGADVVEVLRRPSRGLPQWIEKWFGSKSMRVRDVRAIGARLDDAKVSAKLDSLADDLQLVIDAAKPGRGDAGSTRALLRVIKDDVGLGQAMSLLDASAASSHLDDLEGLEQVAELHPDPAGFEAWLREMLGAPNTAEGITCSTVHRVKGREWRYVAVFGVNDGIMPHRLSDDDEEERRVLHVAVTRGKSAVVVLADETKASPFLGELDGSAPHLVPRRHGSRRDGVASDGGSGSGSGSGSGLGGGSSFGSGKAGGARKPARQSAEATRKGTSGDAASAASAVESSPMLEALRAWRRDRAKRDGVPAYVVMHDKHLVAIVEAGPGSLRELSRIDGMGPRRLELYGDELLAVLGDQLAGVPTGEDPVTG